jgi:hypothetical protein
MKITVIFKFIYTSILLVLFTSVSFGQEEMDFEEFMGTVSESFSDKQLDELSYLFPWDVKVTSYAHGDFSGDGLEDFVVAIRETGVTPKNTVDVYFCRGTKKESFELVKTKNYKWYELNLEVAFLVKSGLCYVTNRDSNNWYFTSYKIKDDKLVQVKKEKYPIEFEKAGE